MYTYKATNFAMGRPVQIVEFLAYGDNEAREIAEKKLPGRNGLVEGGKKGRIIGLKKLV